MSHKKSGHKYKSAKPVWHVYENIYSSVTNLKSENVQILQSVPQSGTKTNKCRHARSFFHSSKWNEIPSERDSIHKYTAKSAKRVFWSFPEAATGGVL